MGNFQLEEKMAKGGKRPICIAFVVFTLICVILLALTIYFATKEKECKGIVMHYYYYIFFACLMLL